MLLAESPGTREVRPTVVTLFLTATLLASVVSTGESLDVGFRRRLDKRQGKSKDRLSEALLPQPTSLSFGGALNSFFFLM